MTREFPRLDTAREALDFALESESMAWAQFDNLWPWRWARYIRQYRLVRRRISWSKSERARRTGNDATG